MSAHAPSSRNECRMLKSKPEIRASPALNLVVRFQPICGIIDPDFLQHGNVRDPGTALPKKFLISFRNTPALNKPLSGIIFQ